MKHETAPSSTATALKNLERDATKENIVPFWTVVDRAHPNEPQPAVKPFVWKWETLNDLLQRAGELVDTAEGRAERRALSLLNPGLGGRYGTTHTLIAGVQMILPGEIAYAHRHTPDALRFIIEGHGAYTTVEGEKVYIEPGDLVLTPSWLTHDHGNESNESVIWMDALDVPLVNLLDVSFFEQFKGWKQEPKKPTENSLKMYGSGLLSPSWQKPPARESSPLLVYRWGPTLNALRQLADAETSPFDDVALEYRNPFTGGPVMASISCCIQLLRPGVRTSAHRHTSSVVYFVVRGRGHSLINGERFDWKERDFLVLPNWAWHEHANESASEEAILFSVSDRPVLDALGLYREERRGQLLQTS